MRICELEYQHKAPFTVPCRVLESQNRTASNGSPYISFKMEDISGSLKARLWPKQLKVNGTIHEFDRVLASGEIREMNGTWFAAVTALERIEVTGRDIISLIPRSFCPIPELVEDLGDALAFIHHKALRTFAESVLGDDSIIFDFISRPASSEHHHSFDGGLLDHSLDCAAMVSRYTEFPKEQHELGFVAALFHDIGKIRTLYCPGKHTPTGHVLDHDALTLEVLAPHLQLLDRLCPDAGIALRYLWTWRNKSNSRGFPLLTVAEAVMAADRISTGKNMAEKGFGDCPDWQRFAKVDNFATHWRPRMELTGGK